MVSRRDEGDAQLADQQGAVMTDVTAARKAGTDVPSHGVTFGEAVRGLARHLILWDMPVRSAE